MNRNETNALMRLTPGIPVYDTDGLLASGRSFKSNTGECLISLDGAALVAAAIDAVETGRGLYYYPPSQAETNVNVAFTVVLAQKARMNLATKTTTCTTKIRSRVGSDSSNNFTLAWVQSGIVSPTSGTLVKSGTWDYTFTFQDGVTTVANFEALITASADLEIDATGAVRTLVTADAFTITNLSGGLRDASYTQSINQTSTAAAIGSAVWSTILVGSYSAGDLTRLFLAIQAGPVIDFTTGTQVYRCPVTSKVRLTVTTDATGRLTTTIGDLT